RSVLPVFTALIDALQNSSPMTQGLTLLPLGIEALLKFLGWTEDAPICLLLSLAECAAVVIIYRLSLDWLGGRLQGREQRILETVTDRAP
ncbi:MAG: hypothetical protein WKF75_19525, partial [Singulisphaera sp.]